MKKICIGCKNEFITRFDQKKYCTKKCRWRSRGIEKVCLECKCIYIGREGRLFCSSKCFGNFHKVNLIDRNIRNRKYPSIKGLSRQKIYWMYNPDARKKDLQRDQKKREDLIRFLGGVCVKCKYKEDIKALELDHKNSDGDKDRKKHGTKIARYYIKNLDEAKKNLQVLCSNCNKIKAVQKNEHSKSRRTKFIYGEKNPEEF